MRRADRLFRIIQIMRRKRGLVTGRDLAEELEVSLRTVYRDIADLVASGVPVEGEPGVGYLLREGYTLPPLMFTPDEIDSIVLGARIVESWADPELVGAAQDALAKIEAVLPDRLKPLVVSDAFSAPHGPRQEPVSIDLAALRHAIRERRKVTLTYSDAGGHSSERIVWPLTLSFYGPVWHVIAWCELRDDFRSFRADRMKGMEPLDERFPDQRGRRLRDYLVQHASWND